jgi:hypothetical protein
VSEPSRRWLGDSRQAAGGPSCEHGWFRQERRLVHTGPALPCGKSSDGLRAAAGVSWWRLSPVFTRGRARATSGKRQAGDRGGRNRESDDASAKSLTEESVFVRGAFGDGSCRTRLAVRHPEGQGSISLPLNRRNTAKNCGGHRMLITRVESRAVQQTFKRAFEKYGEPPLYSPYQMGFLRHFTLFFR